MPGLDWTELPAPPPGKQGWPWTVEQAPASHVDVDHASWPTITVVTPNRDHGRYLEETIRSVLLQGYPKLEYIVVDGASTDDSVEILKRYERWLSFWVSEPDGGQADAINKGLRRSSGMMAAWINSGDMLHPRALVSHVQRVRHEPGRIYVGTCAVLDGDGQVLKYHTGRIHSILDLVRIQAIWRNGGHIIQPEVLFSTDVARAVGFLDSTNHHAMDVNLWGRMLLAGATIEYTDVPFGMFRLHQDQKTADSWRMTKSLANVAEALVKQHPSWSDGTKASLIQEIREYRRDVWRGTGRLARWRVPEFAVQRFRSLRNHLAYRLRPRPSNDAP